MKKKVIIGIDFSKLTIDVSFFHTDDMESIYYEQFENSKYGCAKLLKWIRSRFPDPQEWLFCGEHTGLYSMTVASVLNETGIDLWLENPLQINRSSGINREKNDKIDSLQIALYAWRFIDRVKLYRLNSNALMKIKELITFKDRLTKIKIQLSVPASELERVWDDWDETAFIVDSGKELIAEIASKIKAIETKIKVLLKSEPELWEKYELVTSVVGVGIQTAVYLLVHTMGFKSFVSARQLACFSGVAPFSKTSGTSLKGKKQVSHIANKKLKSLLHMCALNAVRYDPLLKAFYEKKQKEGKHNMSIMNVIRNKIIHRIWAVVSSGKPYVKDYVHDMIA